jgi:pantothenate kinase type III
MGTMGAAATNAVTIGLALGVCLACTAIGAQVSRSTRCAIRLGIFAMFVGALAQVLGGWIEFGDWPQMVFFAGALIYLVANLRAPVVCASSSWANGLAWAIAGVVLTVLGFTFSAGV